jgi:hypothetical protein
VWTGARGAAALGAWLAVLAAFVGPAWSQQPSLLALATPAAFVRPLPARAMPDYELVVLPAQVEPELSVFTTSVADREPTDLRLLVTDGERWRLMEVGASVTLTELDAKIMASGQLPHIVTEPVLPGPDSDEPHEPASLAITARVGGFEAGAQYRSAGKHLERLIKAPASYRDREGHEVWVAQRFGALRLRLADSELTDNVDRNLALPRTTKDQTAVTAELGLDGWPVLGLTLASGDSTRVKLTRDGQEGTPERHEFESITGSVYYYGGPAWSVSASSTFSRSRHAVRSDDDMVLAYHDLSLTLRPHEALTVTPTLSLGQERYEPSGLGIDTGTAGLTLSYAPPRSRWSAWSYVGYTSTRASDASTDARSVSVTGALTYGLGRWLPGCTVSFQAGYDRYVDTAVPESAARAVSGFVLLKFAAF